jgi:hypothetical protein
MEQRTKEWYDARKYKFTSSNIWKLVVDPVSKEAKEKGDLSETAKTYVLEKITEEIGGFIPEAETNAMIYGQEQENEAVYWYKFKTGFEVESIGFIEVNEFYGGSPDRAVLTRSNEGPSIGALEVKCPYSSVNHLWHCLIKDQAYFKKNHKEYYWQCISHMITMDVMWCDFVSFDPRIDNELGLFIFRVYYDSDDATKLKYKISKALEYKEHIKTELGLCA